MPRSGVDYRTLTHTHTHMKQIQAGKGGKAQRKVRRGRKNVNQRLGKYV